MSQSNSPRRASPPSTLKPRSKFDNLYGHYNQTGLLTPPLTPPRPTFELPVESEQQSTASSVASPHSDYPALAKKCIKILGAEAKDMACDIVRGQIKKMVKGLFWKYFHILFAMTVGVTILGSLVLCVAVSFLSSILLSLFAEFHNSSSKSIAASWAFSDRRAATFATSSCSFSSVSRLSRSRCTTPNAFPLLGPSLPSGLSLSSSFRASSSFDPELLLVAMMNVLVVVLLYLSFCLGIESVMESLFTAPSRP